MSDVQLMMDIYGTDSKVFYDESVWDDYDVPEGYDDNTPNLTGNAFSMVCDCDLIPF